LKTNKLHKLTAIVFTMIFSTGFMLNASSRYSPISISSTNPDTPYEDTRKPLEEIVTNVEELEPPLQKKGPGLYYDDFNRRAADEIRKDAKTMYEKQEKAKELTSMDEVVLPLIKITNLHDNNYSYSYYYRNDELNPDFYVYFYDALGRKLSEELGPEANKIYEKNKRRNDVSCWASASVHDIWRYIWCTVRFIITIMILFFVAALFYKKVIKK